MATTTAPAVRIPEPLAVDAAVAQHPAGPRSICGHTIRRGDRYAVLTVTGQLAHVSCIASAAGTDTGRAA